MSKHVAMQSRCPECLGEQYALNVPEFSWGISGCTKCGQRTTVMTDAAWREALRVKYQQRELRRGEPR